MTYLEKLKSPKWQKKSGIYKLIINNEIYVGSAVNLTKRIRSHYNGLTANKHCNIHLQRAFNKYQNFDFDVIETVSDINLLISREQYYINDLNPKYNIARIAGSQLGLRHSESTKKYISELQIGKKVSIETREKMSLSKLGYKATDTHKFNISESKKGDKNPYYKAGKNHPQYGKTKSKETIAKMLLTRVERGTHSGERNPASRSGVLYDVETGSNYMFQSLKPLCEALGLSYGGAVQARTKEKFFNGRYFISYISIPKRISTKLSIK